MIVFLESWSEWTGFSNQIVSPSQQGWQSCGALLTEPPTETPHQLLSAFTEALAGAWLMDTVWGHASHERLA